MDPLVRRETKQNPTRLGDHEKDPQSPQVEVPAVHVGLAVSQADRSLIKPQKEERAFRGFCFLLTTKPKDLHNTNCRN